jgi:hypothetical protein
MDDKDREITEADALLDKAMEEILLAAAKQVQEAEEALAANPGLEALLLPIVTLTKHNERVTKQRIEIIRRERDALRADALEATIRRNLP